MNDTQELRRWLLNFGAYAEVISPPSLREEMQTIIADMSQRYGMPQGNL